MPRTQRRPLALPLIALLALLSLAFAMAIKDAGAASGDAGAKAAKHGAGQRMVVRGEATVGEAGCVAGVCTLEIAGGSFRGTPVGTGAYSATVKLRLAEGFPNGEGGGCAPIDGTLVLGTGTPDRLVLGIDGDSCQDGSGPLDASSFTGMTRFHVKYGTGAYKKARGSGLATFLEDAADRERMTLIGSIKV